MGTHLLFLSQLLAVTAVLGNDRIFTEQPEDAELLGNRPVILGCHFSQPVKECRWLRGGGIVDMKKGRYELTGNKALGDCTLHIQKPQIGLDTTFWQCVVGVTEYTKRESKPARIVVKGYPRPTELSYDDANKTNSELNEPVLYVNNNQTAKTVVLESLVHGDVRVRWYVDGVITPTSNFVENRGSLPSLLRSSMPLVVTKESLPVLAQYCLELRSGSTMKTIHIGAVYVVGDKYEVRHNRKKELNKLHFKVVAPKLLMVWTMDGKDTVINRNRAVVHTDYHDTRNLTVRCVDESGSPSTYLRWGQYDPEEDAEVEDGGYEFSRTKASREMITMDVSFIRPNRYLTLQCQAGNVIHQGIQRSFSAMLTLRYRNACGEDFATLPHLSGSTANTAEFSLVTFLCIYFIYFLSFEL